MDTANTLASRGSARVIKWLESKVVQARVVGGGHVQCHGKAEVEFLLYDEQTGHHRPFKEVFHLIEGPPTCILGNTFHEPYGCIVNLEEGFAAYRVPEGEYFTTPVTCRVEGRMVATMATSEALCYVKEPTVIRPGLQTIEVFLPEIYEGRQVHLTPLRGEISEFLRRSKITFTGNLYTVLKGGRIVVPMFGGHTHDRQLPAMSAVAHYALDVEVRTDLRPSDEQIQAIVDGGNWRGDFGCCCWRGHGWNF